MFRKSKIEPVEKVKIVERYLAGEIGIQQAGKELGVDHHSIRNWISIYQYDGPTGLLNQPKNKSYSKDLKISAINDYLNGEGSLQDICTKYGIRSHRQLSDWIKVYNSGGILKTSTGGAYMKKAKNTTPSRTPEEELRDKIAELERRNLDLQMENDLLKKVRELERRGRYL